MFLGWMQNYQIGSLLDSKLSGKTSETIAYSIHDI